jgi:hypothetical protein
VVSTGDIDAIGLLSSLLSDPLACDLDGERSPPRTSRCRRGDASLSVKLDRAPLGTRRPASLESVARSVDPHVAYCDDAANAHACRWRYTRASQHVHAATTSTHTHSHSPTSRRQSRIVRCTRRTGTGRTADCSSPTHSAAATSTAELSPRGQASCPSAVCSVMCLWAATTTAAVPARRASASPR